MKAARKVLLTGALGYVGTIVRTHLGKRYDLTGVDARGGPPSGCHMCDLTDAEAVLRLAQDVNPDVVIHAAWNKNIDFCEKNPAQALRINGEAVRNLAAAFGRRSRIIYLSTDYVFDGQRGGYAEDDRPCPKTSYGRSKLLGEIEGSRAAGGNFIILRASTLYDLDATFSHFLRERLSRSEPVECFSDVIYSPTYFRDFLNILEGIAAGAGGDERTFHACGMAVSRYDFALAFARVFGHDPSLLRPSSGKGAGMYLFPDLSLDNARTRRLLTVTTTGVDDALREMGREVKG